MTWEILWSRGTRDELQRFARGQFPRWLLPLSAPLKNPAEGILPAVTERIPRPWRN